ncbi:hypothetical protein Tco_1295108 [Tanacetum coccineum]
MGAAVKQCFVDKKYYDIQKKKILDNDRLLEHIICQDVMNILMHADYVTVNVLPANNKCLVHDNLKIERLEQENEHLFELLLSQDIVHICVNSLATRNECCEMQQSFIHEYNENLVLKAEIAKKEHMIEKKFFDEVSSTSASRSQPSGNTKNNMISRPTSSKLKDKVEVQPRSVKSNSNKKNYVAESDCNADVKHTILNSNSELICAKYNQCMFDANHDVYFLEYVNDVNVLSKSKSGKRSKTKQTWKPTGKVFTDIGYRWKPTGWTITIVGNSCPFTRLTSTEVEPLKETTLKLVTTSNLEIKIYRRKTKVAKLVDLNSELSILGSRLSRLFSGTVRFDNDQIAKIMGYGDYQMGNVMISKVYYVEGLGHNLFSVGKFCDSDLEVTFRKHTCYIRDLEGVDLLKGSRGSNLYTLSLEDIMSSSPIYLLSKASKTKSWLWHRRYLKGLWSQVVRSDPERGRSYDYLQACVKHIDRVRSIDVATQANSRSGSSTY